jgi:nitroreductase
MSDPASPANILRPLRRVRQVREFTAEPITPDVLAAVADVARWTGSSRNGQPWRFLAIRDPVTLRRLEAAGQPLTRALATAAAAIAIVLPAARDQAISNAYDEGRAAERIMIAATLLDLGAGITWARDGDVRAVFGQILGLPSDRMVRTIVALGHPTEAARRPRAAPGEARLPRAEVVFDERWPGEGRGGPG